MLLYKYIFCLLAFLLFCASNLIVAEQAKEKLTSAKDSNLPPPPPIKWGGKILLELKTGDYIYPRFSPSGRYLAYAESLTVNKVETTTIYLHDFSNNRRRVLLDNKRASKFAVYRVFVVSMRWLGKKRLKVALSDGDVGVTFLTINTSTGKVVKKAYVEAGDDQKQVPLQKQTKKRFPKFDAEVLDAAFSGTFIKTAGRGVILQKNYSGHDPHVWLFDLLQRQIKKLVTLGKKDIYALGGGKTIGQETIFSLTRGKNHDVYVLRKNKSIKKLAQYKKVQWRPRLVARYSSKVDIYFLLQLTESYKKGHNPILRYSIKTGLQEITDCKQCYDFDIARGKKLFVFTHWVGKQRQLKVLRR